MRSGVPVVERVRSFWEAEVGLGLGCSIWL
ncbi:MAG: hypothetical protein RI897_118 [Verrucomicrobiota bacterium]|jgi:hypothetical protein